MKSFSTLAVAALLAGGTMFAAPALAQDQPADAAAAQWAPKLSKQESVALKPVETAVAAQDWAAATAALAAAQGAVTSPDGRYYLGQFQLQIGSGTNNAGLQAQGIDTMIASGGGDPSRAALLYKNQGALAVQAQDYAKADAAYTRWAQLAPNDMDAQIAVAQTKFRLKQPQEALPLFERAIADRQAAGQQAPENWYLLAVQSALDAKLGPKSVALSRALVTAYPNEENWRNGLLIYRQNNDLDPAARMDALRLMHAAKALDGNEYLQLADMLARGRFYGEAKAVVDAGAASGDIAAGNSDAAAILSSVNGRIAEDRAALPGLEGKARSDANGELALRLAEGYYGHSNYAKAAEFYRLALQKGGVDANLVNTRLGMALALGGQQAQAEAALNAVSGPRADLADYWLLWLDQRG